VPSHFLPSFSSGHDVRMCVCHNSHWCEDVGARLCTKYELRHDEAFKTGCNYDVKKVWHLFFTLSFCLGAHVRPLAVASATYQERHSIIRVHLFHVCLSFSFRFGRLRPVAFWTNSATKRTATAPILLTCGGLPMAVARMMTPI